MFLWKDGGGVGMIGKEFQRKFEREGVEERVKE